MKIIFFLIFLIFVPIKSHSLEIFDKLLNSKKIYQCFFDDGSNYYILITNKIIVDHYENKLDSKEYLIKKKDEREIYAENSWIDKSKNTRIISSLLFNKISNELTSQSIGHQIKDLNYTYKLKCRLKK